MTNEEVTESLNLFPSLEHWEGFRELARHQDQLRSEFFAPATRDIREHFRQNLPDVWVCEAFGNQKEDTRWYHSDFGPNSLSLWFGWKYQFILRLQDEAGFDSEGISKALLSPEYAPVQAAMMRCDHHPDSNCKLFEKYNYNFGTASDGQISENALAWFAYHEREEFVRQSIEKIERFLGSPEVVRLLEKLNSEFQR